MAFSEFLMGPAAYAMRGSQEQLQPTQQQGGFFSGTPASVQQYSNLTPQQSDLKSQLLQMLGGRLGGHDLSFEPIAQQMRQGFREDTIPSIMERFAGSSNNTAASSALPQMLGSAGKDFETGLGALRSQYGLQQQGNLMNMLGMMMQPSFENIYHQRQPGFLEGTTTAATPDMVQALVKVLPMLLGLI